MTDRTPAAESRWLRAALKQVPGVAAVYRAIRRAVQRARHRSARREFRGIARGVRQSCWCGGELGSLRWQPGFGVCRSCGTYVNRFPPEPSALAEFYSVDVYWRRVQRRSGLPPIEERAALYRSDGRLDVWLDLVRRFGPRGRRVVEVGCAPGVLLAELSARGYACTGVEISPDVAVWLRQATGLDIRGGAFPGVRLPECDLFLGFDVLEHSPEPVEFLRSAANLLAPGGVAIVQTPIDRYALDPPFGDRFVDLFDDVEHLYLFTDGAIRGLADRAGLEVVSLAESIWIGGEIGILRRPGGPT